MPYLECGVRSAPGLRLSLPSSSPSRWKLSKICKDRKNRALLLLSLRSLTAERECHEIAIDFSTTKTSLIVARWMPT